MISIIQFTFLSPRLQTACWQTALWSCSLLFLLSTQRFLCHFGHVIQQDQKPPGGGGLPSSMCPPACSKFLRCIHPPPGSSWGEDPVSLLLSCLEVLLFPVKWESVSEIAVLSSQLRLPLRLRPTSPSPSCYHSVVAAAPHRYVGLGVVMGRVVVRHKCRVRHGGLCPHPGLAVPQGI